MYIIGMMSGTSLDGIDAVLAQYHEADNGKQGGHWQCLAHAEVSLPATLKDTLYQLNFPARLDNELHRAKIAEHQLTQRYADAYQQLLQQTGIDSQHISAIAAHGQTIRHAPNDPFPYTLQLLDGALLSHLTAQTVINDFRSKDIAAGGQGAPLAPLFHRQLFAPLVANAPFAVVNIGGISNISVLEADKTYGFDCGPGNCLLDEWVMTHRGQAFDKDGQWAKQGRVLPELLARFLQDEFFALPIPKSTGRDYFHSEWLGHYLSDECPVDVMRTLTQLTAEAIAQNVPEALRTLIVTGGGAKNNLLLEALSTSLPMLKVQTSDSLGIDAQHVEAMGFALLGRATLLQQALDTRAITGAERAVILGAVHWH